MIEVMFVPATKPGVAVPVPPLATARVPAKVIVPVVVIGPPLVVKPVVPPDTATLVTVPVPALTLTVTSSPDADAVTDAPTKLMFFTPVEIELPSSLMPTAPLVDMVEMT